MFKLYKEVGQIIVRSRKKKGLKQTELAKKIGTLSSHVSRWETGEHRPSEGYIGMICMVLDIDEEELKAAYDNAAYLEYEKKSSDSNSTPLATLLHNTANILEDLPLNDMTKANLLESLVMEINRAIQQIKEE